MDTSGNAADLSKLSQYGHDGEKNPQETGCEGVDRFRLTLDRVRRQTLVNTALKLCVPQNAGSL